MLAAVSVLLAAMASCGRDQCALWKYVPMAHWLGDYTITGYQVDFFCTRKDHKHHGSEEQKIQSVRRFFS